MTVKNPIAMAMVPTARPSILSKKLIEFIRSMIQKIETAVVRKALSRKMLTRTPPSVAASSAIRNCPPNFTAADIAHLSSIRPRITERNAPRTINPSCGAAQLIPSR